MADPTLALQKALLAALDTGLSCEVYDAVPQDAAYPYVTLDTTAVDNDDYLRGRRDLRFVYLTVWSQQRGQQEVMEIMADIDTALHEKPLTLDTGRVISVRVDRKRTNREPDNETFMGQVTLRVWTRH